MINLQNLKNKTAMVDAMDFVGVVKPSIVDLESKGFFGGELKWSESNKSWALIRSVKGVLLESPENEALMGGIKNKALWFFPFPGQHVTYKIRITQDFINEGHVHLEHEEKMEVFPYTRKVIWEN
jgi:hypothetical protein